MISENLYSLRKLHELTQEEVAETCVCCGKPAKKLVYWGKAY